MGMKIHVLVICTLIWSWTLLYDPVIPIFNHLFWLRMSIMRMFCLSSLLCFYAVSNTPNDPECYTPFQLSLSVKKGYCGNECFGLGSLSRFYMILNTLDLEYFFLEHSFFSKVTAIIRMHAWLIDYNKLFTINDYSISKVFYEDPYKAFIFYVKHPRKVFMYKLFMPTLKKIWV